MYINTYKYFKGILTMKNKKFCEIEDCKANLKHREGAHSNWCPNFGKDYKITIEDKSK